MPLALVKELPEGGVVMLWRMSETEDELAQLVAASDRADAAKISHSGRRMELLAWRAALRMHEQQAEITYNNMGAPQIDEGYVSAAHTDGWAVVMLSQKRCGVDIESVSRNFSKAAPRFLSPAEAALDDSTYFAAAVWCAKEALYKWAGRAGLDFLSDIRITSARMSEGALQGQVAGEAEQEVGFFIHDGHIVAWVAG